MAFRVRRIAGGVKVHLWNGCRSPSGLTIDSALMVDRLSVVMLPVITGVGSLIHVFSVAT